MGDASPSTGVALWGGWGRSRSGFHSLLHSTRRHVAIWLRRPQSHRARPQFPAGNSEQPSTAGTVVVVSLVRPPPTRIEAAAAFAASAKSPRPPPERPQP